MTFGLLVRNMHRWAAHLMVLSVFLHMARVFYHGAYKPPREFNWVIGVILLTLTLLLSFTGYLLPWDQLALWAVTVGTNMMGYTPVFGSQVRFVLLGGVEIGSETLLRWYVLHVLMLPVRDRDLHGDPLLAGPQGRRHLRAAVMASDGTTHDRDPGTPPQAGRGGARQGGRRRGRGAPPRPPRPTPGRRTPPRPTRPVRGGSRIPAHLLERSRAAKAAPAGGEGGEADAGGGGVAVAERPGGVAAAVPAAGPPGRRRSRWPHPAPADRREVGLHPGREGHARSTRSTPGRTCSIGEFVAALACTAFTFVFSIFVNAPLLQLANVNQTPNPSKAPWYFLGLQELLTMFHPMVAGVTIPGMGLFALMLAPYIDRNPSNKPEDRKFAISLFTIFLMFWAVLVIIGSFFRGPGFNFIFPWRDGIFFDL